MSVALKLSTLFVINNVSVFSSYNSDMLLFVAQLVTAVVMFSLSVSRFYIGFTSSLHRFFYIVHIIHILLASCIRLFTWFLWINTDVTTRTQRHLAYCTFAVTAPSSWNYLPDNDKLQNPWTYYMHRKWHTPSILSDMSYTNKLFSLITNNCYMLSQCCSTWSNCHWSAYPHSSDACNTKGMVLSYFQFLLKVESIRILIGFGEQKWAVHTLLQDSWLLVLCRISMRDFQRKYCAQCNMMKYLQLFDVIGW